MGSSPAGKLEKLLSGSHCWYTLAGEGTGSVFQLYLGAKIRRDRPVDNDMLSAEAIWNDPEFHLMVWCAWRLDGPSEPITGWLEPNDNDGPMVRGLAELEGESVVSVRVRAPAWDLELEFTGQKTLNVFCDLTEHSGRGENWHVSGRNGFCVAVEHAGTWTEHHD